MRLPDNSDTACLIKADWLEDHDLAAEARWLREEVAEGPNVVQVGGVFGGGRVGSGFGGLSVGGGISSLVGGVGGGIGFYGIGGGGGSRIGGGNSGFYGLSLGIGFGGNYWTEEY